MQAQRRGRAIGAGAPWLRTDQRWLMSREWKWYVSFFARRMSGVLTQRPMRHIRLCPLQVMVAGFMCCNILLSSGSLAVSRRWRMVRSPPVIGGWQQVACPFVIGLLWWITFVAMALEYAESKRHLIMAWSSDSQPFLGDGLANHLGVRSCLEKGTRFWD